MDRSHAGCPCDWLKAIHCSHVEHAGSEEQFLSRAVSAQHGPGDFEAFVTRREAHFQSRNDRMQPGYVSGNFRKAIFDCISV